MRGGELGGTPAVDGRAHKLLGGDEEAEADENDDAVLPAQAVHVVVIHTELQFPETQHRLEQSLHLSSFSSLGAANEVVFDEVWLFFSFFLFSFYLF